MLELSILSRNKEQANTALSEALTVIREKWEPETTANNINMIIDIRRTRGETVEWIEEIKKELDKATISI